MDGFDLVRNMRADARLRELPVIMITSRIAQKHRDYAAELGVDHYLGKPYSEEDLLALVARYTRNRVAGVSGLACRLDDREARQRPLARLRRGRRSAAGSRGRASTPAACRSTGRASHGAWISASGSAGELRQVAADETALRVELRGSA